MVRDYKTSAVPTVYNMFDVPTFRESDGFEQRIFRGLDLMVGFNVIKPEKADAPPHSHPWEQINMLLEGRLDFIVGEDRIELEPFDIIEIPPGVEHSARTVPGESALLLAFWPLRDDIIDATDYQTEFSKD